LRILLSSAHPIAKPMLDLGETLDFILSLLLAMGLVFQTPLVTAVLSRIGVLDYRTLKAGRRAAIVAIFFVAAIITPDTSMVTQTIVAIPLIVLYEVSILTAKMTAK